MKRGVVLAVMVVLAPNSCGRGRGGGIVDNGNHIPAPAENPTSTDPQGTIAFAAELILKDFIVDLPTAKWKLKSERGDPDEAEVGDERERIIFSMRSPTISCEVEPVKTKYEVELYPCSEMATVLKLEGLAPVLAEHERRTSTVQSVLMSFRRR